MDWADRAALAALIRLLPGRLRMIFAVSHPDSGLVYSVLGLVIFAVLPEYLLRRGTLI